MADVRPPQPITGSALREQLLSAARKQADLIKGLQDRAAAQYQQTAPAPTPGVPPAPLTPTP